MSTATTARTGTSSSTGTGTRPEQLTSSHKRQRGPNLYQYPLPLVPAARSFISSLLSILPALSLTPPQLEAIYDELTKTVWVQNERDMVLLWRQGFFGKGSLSRSEPSWKRRVENKIADAEGRDKNLTSEEMTALRRIERKGTKHIKKLEREAERLQAANAALGTSVSSTPSTPTSASAPLLPEMSHSEQLALSPSGPSNDTPSSSFVEPPPPLWQLQAEHTQLQPEEAFFLLFSLGSIILRPSSPLLPSPSPALSILQAWTTFLLDAATVLPPRPPSLDPAHDPRLNRLDSPFLLSYATYHHYRSMGWVVRSGVKFCTDWVLYGPAGPVGGHAEFAVLIYPNYVDPTDAHTNPFRSSLSYDQIAEGEHRSSWRWLHTANRVCSGVKKTLILLQILIPPLSSLPEPHFVAHDPAKALGMLQMREIVVRRFSPGRMRD